MRVKVDKLADAYKRLQHTANTDGSSVLVCVAADMDAIAASHILRKLLRADNITHTMHPVRGYEDVVRNVDALDFESCRSVVLLNCGANLKIYERFQLDNEERSQLQVFVFDSHRPILLENIFADIMNEVDFENQDLDKARIILMDHVREGADEEYPVPSVQDVIGAELKDDDDDEDEEEDEEEEFASQSPSRQRRRIGEDGESVSGDEDELREKQRRRKECRAVIDEYYRGSYHGQSSATLMFMLAHELRKENNAMLCAALLHLSCLDWIPKQWRVGTTLKLIRGRETDTRWWGLLGLTDQHVHDRIDDQYYTVCVRLYQEEAMRLNPDAGEDKRGGSKVAFFEEFRFLLMQHWTLYNSMYYSNYVASQLGIWKDRTSNKLQTLLAKMGVKLSEARQQFVHMKAWIKERLPAMIAEHADEFALTDVVMGTFRKERKSGNPISATDCIHICSAMLYATPKEKEDWTDCFYKAHDALWNCAEREELWDEQVGGESPDVQHAIDLHQAVVEKAFELAQDRGRIQVFPTFRYAHFTANERTRVLQQPAVLSRLALFLMDMERHRGGGDARRDAKPIVLGVDDEARETCAVVGVVAPNREGYKERNSFGRCFREAVKHFPGMEVQLDGFDTEVIRIPAASFQDFVQCIFDHHHQLTA